MAPGTNPIQFGQNVGLDVLKMPGTNGPTKFESGIPEFQVTGYETVGNPGSATPYFWHDNEWQYNANATWTKGGHNLRFGLDVSRQDMNHLTAEQGAGPRGTFQFTGGVTALNGGPATNQFNAFAAYMLGLASTVGKTVPVEAPVTTRMWADGFYVRDQWQATRNLTITFGVRYEIYPDPYPRSSRSGTIRHHAKQGPDRRHRFGAHGHGRFREPQAVLAAAGIAYRPTSEVGHPHRLRNEHRSLFAGASLPHELSGAGRPELCGGQFVRLRGKNGGRHPSHSHSDPWQRRHRCARRRERQGARHQISPRLCGVVQLHRAARTPRRLRGQAAYVGTRGIRQQVSQELNWAPMGTGNTGRVLNQQFGRVASTLLQAPFGTANYNSLQTHLSRRFSNGMHAQVSYTFSKALALADEADSTLAFAIPSAFGRDRSVTGYDRTHNLQAAFIAELPFGKGKRWAQNGMPKRLLGGWQVNGAFSAYSGTPFTVTASGASLNAPTETQTADQVLPNVKILGGTGPGQSYFDPAAFAGVTAVRYGTSGLNILRGPGVANFDLGLFRQFSATEKIKLQFRAEAFNATNTPHFNNPGTNVSNAVRNQDGSISKMNGYTEITSAPTTSGSYVSVCASAFRCRRFARFCEVNRITLLCEQR